MLLHESVYNVDYTQAEFKTFTVCTGDDYYFAEWKYIKKHFPEHVERILKAIDNDEGYVSLKNVEIQWD